MRKRYSQEIKDKAFKMIAMGEKVSQVAKKLKVSPQILYRWGKESNAEGIKIQLLSTDTAAQVASKTRAAIKKASNNASKTPIFNQVLSPEISAASLLHSAREQDIKDQIIEFLKKENAALKHLLNVYLNK